MFPITLISSRQILHRFQHTGIFPIREYQEPILPYPLLQICIHRGNHRFVGQFPTGQTYFLRGVFYYYLACTFGGVPLELNVSTNGLKPRSSQDSVFAPVVSDMTTAANLLPWPQDLAPSDLGRATKEQRWVIWAVLKCGLKNILMQYHLFNN